MLLTALAIQSPVTLAQQLVPDTNGHDGSPFAYVLPKSPHWLLQSRASKMGLVDEDDVRHVLALVEQAQFEQIAFVAVAA